MLYRASCNSCGQSAVHRTDEQAWDDVYHLDLCEAADMPLGEAEIKDMVCVGIALAVPAA